jgi:hypothetical protein
MGDASGEVVINPMTTSNPAMTANGDLTLHNSFVNVSGDTGGSISLQGGRLFMQDSSILSNSDETLGGKIDVHFKESIVLDNDLPSMAHISQKSSQNGDINIQTDQLDITGTGIVSVSVLPHSQGGDINVIADKIQIKEGGYIAALSKGGQSGDISIQATNSVALLGHSEGTKTIDDFSIENLFSWIVNLSYLQGTAGNIDIVTSNLLLDEGRIQTNAVFFGKSGDIEIKADNIQLINGGIIDSATHGIHAGGTVSLQVSNELRIAGQGDLAITALGLHFPPGPALLPVLVLNLA